MDNQRKIADHYNKIESIAQEKRGDSKIINIRNMNNFIKTLTLQKYCNSGNAVLDLGCGKGGDLKKYAGRRIQTYVGIDIAAKSLHEAKERFESMRGSFVAEFIERDAYNNSMDLNEHFDLVVSQFSFHYAFQSEHTFKTSVANIQRHLKEGGFFLATIPNAETLMRRYYNNGNNYGNEFYNVKFVEPYEDIQKRKNRFGIEYYFVLEEAIENCVEYLIDMKIMVDEFKKYDIELVEDKDFLSFFNANYKDHRDLHDRYMKKRLSMEELKAVELYKVVVFQKK